MTDAGEVVIPEPQAPSVEAPPPPPVVVAVEPKKKKPLIEKKPKEKKPRQHKSAAHPPYFQMIKDAITALDERSGSSPYAIAKHIESEHKSVLPANFRKILSLQLKNSAARGKLIKIKASYKLSQAGKREEATRTPITRAARANAAKPEENVTKKRRSSRSKSVNQIEAAAKAKAAGGRRTRKSAPATKAKQPKSIRSTVKKARKTVGV